MVQQEARYKVVDHAFTIYKVYDKSGALLYVGATTVTMATRMAIHRADKSPWLIKMAWIETEALGTREEMIARERSLILDCNPPFNVARHAIVTIMPILSEYVSNVGKVLREQGRSARWFMRQMDVSMSLYYQIEKRTRRPTAEYRHKAAEILDTPECELFIVDHSAKN